MTLADFRRLAQRWQDDYNEGCAHELFVVIQDVEARLEGLDRYAMFAREHHPIAGNDIHFCRMEPDKTGAFVTFADLAACLVGAQEPTT